MPKLRPDEDTWPLYQAIGTWTVAMVLILAEGLNRHFIDQGALPFAGMLLGVPIVANYERNRRRRRDDDDK